MQKAYYLIMLLVGISMIGYATIIISGVLALFGGALVGHIVAMLGLDHYYYRKFR